MKTLKIKSNISYLHVCKNVDKSYDAHLGLNICFRTLNPTYKYL